MEKRKIEQLRQTVLCQTVLEDAGFSLDKRESSPRALKYRRHGEIIIVNHEGRGWFDPLSEAKGDVFNLAQYLDNIGFTNALDHVAGLIDFVSADPKWQDRPFNRKNNVSIGERWQNRRKPWSRSSTWRYLAEKRFLPDTVIRAAVRCDRLREGPYGSMWAVHTDDEGVVTGWEERGPDWRGFSTGGAKVLFRFGSWDAHRICVTEAAIDAMSLATLECLRGGSLYVSTGGGWSSRTEMAIRKLAENPSIQLIAATDANPQGEAYASRTREIADDVGCEWLRMRPSDEDWNEVLRQRFQKN